MPRKLLISTLILAAGGLVNLATASPPASAMIKKDDTLYWSFGEMAKFNIEITTESEGVCGSDEMCKEMYIHERKEQSSTPEKYQALEYFKGVSRLIFPTINPSTEMFSLYYRDRDETAEMENGPFSVREIYLAWVENSVPDPRYQAYWDGDDAITPYVADIRRGLMSPGVHELYHANVAKNGEKWLRPNIVMTIDAGSSGLANNQNHLIHFTVLATNNGNMLGATDYSSCFNWGTYQEGMECRIMYSGTGWPVYFPAFPGAEIPGVEVVAEPEPEPEVIPEPEEPTPEPTPEPEEPTPELEPTLEPEPIVPEPTPEPEIAPEMPATPTTPKISTSTIGVLTTTTISTPDMTSATSPQESVEVPLAAKPEKAHEFPWWFIAFIFSGIALILWWFIPLPKRRKKSEKSLDKSDQIE